MDRRHFLASLGTAAVPLAGCAAPTSEPSTPAADLDGIRAETVATGLEIPWGAAWRDGDCYLTERPGRILRVPGGTGDPVTVTADFPSLAPTGEGGLLGLVFGPDGDAYTYGTYRVDGRLENRVVRHDTADGWRGEPILTGIPAGKFHDGGRLAAHDGALYVTTGDAGRGERAQDRDSLAGKVLRLTFGGDPHPDNPFDSAVFSYGHRNPQGLAFRDGTLFSTEHGPDTDDEVNVLQAGRNYGWPVVRGRSDRADFTDPVVTYTPTIAPGSATFYDGPIEQWRGDFFFGTLIASHLHRIRFDGTQVVEQERHYSNRFGRLRTAFTGPDGHLYVTTSNRDGRGIPVPADDRLIRFVPA